MQPWENMKSQKSYKQAVWLENIDQSRSKTRTLTFLHHIAKPLAEISKMYLQPVWPTKIILRLLAANLSTTANQVSATASLIQQKQHGDYKKKLYGKLCRTEEASYKAPMKSDEIFFFLSVIFLFLKEFFQRKVLTCEIYLRGLRP